MLKKSLLLAGFLICCLAVSSRAQTAEEILNKTSSLYRSAEQYHLEGTVSVQMKAGDQQQALEMNLILAERKPDEFRAQIEGQAVQMQVVSNGDSTWIYMPALNQFMAQGGAFDRQIAGQSLPDLLAEYGSLTDSIETLALVREEPVTLRGENRDSYVISIRYKDRASVAGHDSTRKTVWIDKQNGLILKDETKSQMPDSPFGGPLDLEETTLFSHVSVGQPVADSLFVFNPPSGAERVFPEQYSGSRGERPGSAGLEGSDAHDFTLEKLAGGTVSLASLRGKVVLVNFWATWCGPCRQELPVIEQLHKQYGDRDLVVLAVDVAEVTDDVKAYVEENGYTFPVLLDSDGAIANLYGAMGIPASYVVNREGKVVRSFVGARSEKEFMEALQEAGL